MLHCTENEVSHREHRGFAESSKINALTHEIIGCAMTVHKRLGAGLLENVYRQCLVHEISKKNFFVQQEVSVPLEYDQLKFETGFRADIIVNNILLIEVKSVERIIDVHKAQTLTYIKMLKYPVGLLINFREPLLKNGIHRFINNPDHKNSAHSVPSSATSV